MDARMMRFVEESARAGDMTALNGFFSATLAGFGFSYFAYSRLNGAETAPGQVFATSYPQAWVERYVARGYAAVDPVVAQAMDDDQPFLWSQARAPEEAASLFADAARHGIVSGLAVPILLRDGGKAVVSLASPLSDGALETAMAEDGKLLPLLCYVYHQVAAQLLGLEATRPHPLPPRVANVLRWMAKGHGPDEIAVKLSLPVATVAALIGEAVQRLGVSDSGRLADEAVRRGFI